MPILFRQSHEIIGSSFSGIPARSGRTWVIVSEIGPATFYSDRPTTSIFGSSATSRRTIWGSGSTSPGPPLLACAMEAIRSY
jgi:hypothetical protein